MNRVLAGSYRNCSYGNLIFISGDRGKSVNFNGRYIKDILKLVLNDLDIETHKENKIGKLRR